VSKGKPYKEPYPPEWAYPGPEGNGNPRFYNGNDHKVTVSKAPADRKGSVPTPKRSKQGSMGQ